MSEVWNKYLVGLQGDDVVILGKGIKMSRDDALNMAAWIVAVADPLGNDFRELLEAVMST